MRYAIILLSLALVSTIAYAISIETDPKVLVEQQNQKALRECLKKAINESSSDKILQAKKSCDENLLSEVMTYSGQLISWTASGAIVPPPKQIEKKLDEKKLQECLSKYDKIDNTISNVCMDYAEWIRTSNINFELETEKLSQLHQNVCKKQINSPLCKDRELFDRLYQLTEERLPWKNFYPILLGITNAESSLWLSYAKDRVWWTCAGRNNWWWIKWKINDDGSRQKDQSIPDQYGCYLYKFNSIEEYWISKVNTVRFWYKWCVDHATPIRCMSYAYVGDRNVAEESWIRNVSIFLN